jgi:beta-phosphoglucomutase-like phosphatase (HAD superfamily)
MIPSWLGSAAAAEQIERIAQAKEELCRHSVSRAALHTNPGLQGGCAGCTIASAAPRANIDAVLEALSASHIFQGIVSAEDVHRG